MENNTIKAIDFMAPLHQSEYLLNEKYHTGIAGGGWYALLAGNVAADLVLDVAKALGAKGAVAFFITTFLTAAIFIAAALWYYKWFDKILKRTYIVNLIKRRKKNVKKESEKVSENESNS